MLQSPGHMTAAAEASFLGKLLRLAHCSCALQADFEPNSRKLRGHERIPAIYESEVCLINHASSILPSRLSG